MDTAELSGRYRGEAAEFYEARRREGSKWQREQDAVDRLLSHLAPGASIVDVPVGTGRFLELYKRYELSATGIDISEDMLALARKKAEQLTLDIRLERGDILRIDAADNIYDLAVCIRFLNWIDTATLRLALRELTRIARQKLIIGIRTYVPVSEIQVRSFAGMKRYLWQQAWRAVPLLRRRLFIHESSAFAGILAENGLKIESVTCTDRTYNGSDYNIYLLSKLNS